jgi:hypothetical protein
VLGRTPRELAASVTSEDVTEMMAFERLEPFGSLQQMLNFGQVCQVIANVNRDEKRRPQPYRASDFFPALAMAAGESSSKAPEPVLLEDPEAQSRLIKESIFGVKGCGRG